MKKLLLIVLMFACGITVTLAQKITFNSPDVCLWHHSDLGPKACRNQV